MLNNRPLNPKSFLESRCNCLRMMLNSRSLNRYRRKVDYVCSLRMMLNRRDLNLNLYPSAYNPRLRMMLNSRDLNQEKQKKERTPCLRMMLNSRSLNPSVMFPVILMSLRMMLNRRSRKKLTEPTGKPVGYLPEWGTLFYIIFGTWFQKNKRPHILRSFIYTTKSPIKNQALYIIVRTPRCHYKWRLELNFYLNLCC